MSEEAVVPAACDLGRQCNCLSSREAPPAQTMRLSSNSSSPKDVQPRPPSTGTAALMMAAMTCSTGGPQ
jgi:hypothetical protein